MRPTHSPVFAGRHNVDLFAVPFSGHGLLYALVHGLPFGYGSRHELKVPFPPTHEYLSIILSLRRIPVKTFDGSLLANLGLWFSILSKRLNRRIPALAEPRTGGMVVEVAAAYFFLLESRTTSGWWWSVQWILFDNSSIDLANALLAFKCTQKMEWSESSCLGWFLYCFAKRAIEGDKAFATLGQKRGT